MDEYQPNTPGPYTDVYPPNRIGGEVFFSNNTDLMGAESPFTAFSAPSSLQFPGEHCSGFFGSPDNGGNFASAQACNDLLVNDFVPGLNTISLNYWNPGFTGFTAESIAEPSPGAPSEYAPTPEHSSRSPSTAKSPAGKRKRKLGARPSRKSTIQEPPRYEQTNMQTDINRETPSSHEDDGSSCGGQIPLITKPSKRQDTHQRHKSNRVAAHKSRTKKNQASQRLRTDTKNKEQVNSELINCVADLKLEVQELKMQLLQHTDCNCVLIQKYIAHEARQYIQGIEHTCDSEGLAIAGP